MEELGQGQLPWTLGRALNLTHEHPHPVWNRRDHLVDLGRQKKQVGLRMVSVSGLVSLSLIPLTSAPIGLCGYWLWAPQFSLNTGISLPGK